MGAGDELLVTGHVKQMYLKDPRKVKLRYERNRHWHPVFDNNPKIAHWTEEGDFQEYYPRTNGMRPYCVEKSPTKWKWKEYKPIPGELFFMPTEKNFASMHKPEIIVEPSLKKGASPNKDWGWERWQELTRLLGLEGFKVSQLGPRGINRLSGAEWIETLQFRDAAAVIAKAKVVVLPEGGLHHAAAAVGTKAVVLYGGYISPKQTGYDSQTNLFTGGEPCGNRLHCDHCKQAMAQITPEQVVEEVKKLR